MTPMLAKKYDGQDPTGWWMSEKLDGVRAIWTGSKLLSRTGKEFAAPEWFVKGLPDNLTLDGELWEGRGLFSQTCGKVRKQINPDWTGIKYMVFDCVCVGTFAARYRLLYQTSLPDHIEIVKQCPCSNMDHLNQYERGILNAGGEGVMLKNPVSSYEQKRSSELLKLKRFITDEAVVDSYDPGQGKYEGMVGALMCKYRDQLIKIGTGLTDSDRREPPGIGSVITFKYFELTEDKMPRFPVYLACRDYE